MNRSKIEWTDYTLNPIKGICPVRCWFCYARAIYRRFGWNPEIRIAKEFPGMIFTPAKKRVFICSTFELFHPVVKREWRDWIFDIIEYNKDTTFQILTKFPQNIDRLMPENVWLGCTITGEDNQWKKGFDLYMTHEKKKFISFEPLLKPVEIIDELLNFEWIIIGRLTGFGHKYDPPRIWIEEIVEECKYRGIPVFLKNNLKEIWKEPLIQEWPK